jgi:hypothetical protein
MTHDIQLEALSAIAELCNLAPDIRLGQLLAHLGFLGESHLGRGLADMDDDELLAIIYRHRSELAARMKGGMSPVLPPIDEATSVSGSSTLSAK